LFAGLPIADWWTARHDGDQARVVAAACWIA
jgi:hypothetical protein